MVRFIIFLPIMLCLPLSEGYAQNIDENHCLYFYEQLKNVPHEKLDYNSGTITFLWDKKEYTGCELTFVTNDSLLADTPRLPRFTRGPDSTLLEKGWRQNINYTADGPGTGVYGIEKGNILCLIDYSQPATLVDPGNIVHETVLTIRVQCRESKK